MLPSSAERLAAPMSLDVDTTIQSLRELSAESRVYSNCSANGPGKDTIAIGTFQPSTKREKEALRQSLAQQSDAAKSEGSLDDLSVEEALVALKATVVRQQEEIERNRNQLRCMLLLVDRAWLGEQTATDHLSQIVGREPIFCFNSQDGNQALQGQCTHTILNTATCHDAQHMERAAPYRVYSKVGSQLDMPLSTPVDNFAGVTLHDMPQETTGVELQPAAASPQYQEPPLVGRGEIRDVTSSYWQFQLPDEADKSVKESDPAFAYRVLPLCEPGRAADTSSGYRLVKQVEQIIRDKEIELPPPRVRCRSAPPSTHMPQYGPYEDYGVEDTHQIAWQNVDGSQNMESNRPFALLGKARILHSAETRRSSPSPAVSYGSRRPVSGKSNSSRGGRSSRNSRLEGNEHLSCTPRKVSSGIDPPPPSPRLDIPYSDDSDGYESSLSSSMGATALTEESHFDRQQQLRPKSRAAEQSLASEARRFAPPHSAIAHMLPHEAPRIPSPSPYRQYNSDKRGTVPARWTSTASRNQVKASGQPPQYRMYKIAEGTKPIFIDHAFMSCFSKPGSSMCHKCSLVESDIHQASGTYTETQGGQRQSRRQLLPAQSTSVRRSWRKSERQICRAKVAPTIRICSQIIKLGPKPR